MTGDGKENVTYIYKTTTVCYFNAISSPVRPFKRKMKPVFDQCNIKLKHHLASLCYGDTASKQFVHETMLVFVWINAYKTPHTVRQGRETPRLYLQRARQIA